jgi:tRNA (guanine37-N1)-methyltransferase
MNVGIVTLFPELFDGFLRTSLVGRAVTLGALNVTFEPLREHGLGRYQSVDDTPYGGGAGMVLRVDCVVAAVEALEAKIGAAHRVLLSPQGQPFRQATARRWSKLPSLAFICGRYEGFDERVRDFVHEEASLGDFVLTGGEVAVMAMIEASVRLLPSVLGNEASPEEESFSAAQQGRLEYPQYTRPAEFRGRAVPEVLKSGHHQNVRLWRDQQSLQRTQQRRPDLLTSESATVNVVNERATVNDVEEPES